MKSNSPRRNSWPPNRIGRSLLSFGGTARILTLTAQRIFAGPILIVCCLFLTGCSTPQSPGAGSNSDLVQATGFCQPYLMYILASPHPRLYVEVDAVEGCAPSQVTLNKLRDFLTAYCDKPGGIEV